MRVLVVSTSYPRDASDWRGLFIRHLVGAMARIEGLDLKLWAPPGEIPSAARGITTPQESAWLGQLMEAGGISHLMRSRKMNVLAPLKLLRMLRSAYLRTRDIDAYHVNWLQCALPLPDNGIPALIGVLGNDLKLLRLPLMRAALRRVMRRRRLALCPNAEWMRAPLEAAFGDVAEIVPVSFGVDPRWFAIERAPGLRPRWLAVTRLTADKLGPLFDWSAPLFAGSARELHLFGPMQESIAVPEWVHYHNAASADALAAEWFPSATGLITLSRHAEGRPQVMLEAMAAGLPILASRMPAHASVIRDGVSGFLCGTGEEYARAMTRLEDAQTNDGFGAAARKMARDEYGTWDDCAQRYLQIHRRLLSESIRA